jgi:hypothetical protein
MLRTSAEALCFKKIKNIFAPIHMERISKNIAQLALFNSSGLQVYSKILERERERENTCSLNLLVKNITCCKRVIIDDMFAARFLFKPFLELQLLVKFSEKEFSKARHLTALFEKVFLDTHHPAILSKKECTKAHHLCTVIKKSYSDVRHLATVLKKECTDVRSLCTLFKKVYSDVELFSKEINSFLCQTVLLAPLN